MIKAVYRSYRNNEYGKSTYYIFKKWFMTKYEQIEKMGSITKCNYIVCKFKANDSNHITI